MPGVRNKVIVLRKSHPEFTLSDIAAILDITKQRVSQILISENLPRHSTKYKSKFQSCKVCGRATVNKFCSNECRDVGLNAIVFCDFCKKSLKVSKKHYAYGMKMRKHYFCSNECRFLGRQVFRG